MRNTGLDEAQAGIKIAGRNINNLRYADDTTLMAESTVGNPAKLLVITKIFLCMFFPPTECLPYLFVSF